MSSSVEGGDLGQDPEPGERVLALVHVQRAVGDRLAAHAVEAVAAGDDVAAQLLLGAVVAEADAGRVGVDARDGDVLDLEEQRAAGVQAGVDQVLDDLLLPVDGDRRAAGELGQGDAVADAVEAQLEALVHEPLALEPLAQPGWP